VHLLEEERGFGGLPESNQDPVRLAEQWARKGQHEVLLFGMLLKRPVPGVTAVDFPTSEAAEGLQSTVREFLESHAHPALILAGVERLFAAHRTDDAVKVLGEIVDTAKGLGPVAIGFDPRGVSDAAVSSLRAVMASTRVHDTLGALANPLRRLILRRLDEGPTSFTEVMRAAGIDDSPKLSFHLRTLQEGGLVSHGSDSYELTAAGEEAIRVLKEVDEIGSAEGARAFLFPVAPPAAAATKSGRKAS
jgi:DNA-binding HxlR family transcriptional regulator